MRIVVGLSVMAAVCAFVSVACNGDDDYALEEESPDAGGSVPDAGRVVRDAGNAVPDAQLPDAAVPKTVRGTIVGLRGSGLELTNGGESIAIAAQATSFQFTGELETGATYAVTVKSQPTGPHQECTVAGASGVVGSTSVDDVVVTCTTSTFLLGGTLTGLARGAAGADAAAHSVVLRNGNDTITLGQDGTFSFPTRIESAATFAVTIEAQPTLPSQLCVLAGAEGSVLAGDVMTVAVNCTTNTYAVGGSVSGASGTVVLRINDAEDATVNANGTYAFGTLLASGSAYSVAIASQPTTQTCTLSDAQGSIGSAPIDNVNLTCVGNPYALGVNVTGYAGSTPLVLQNSAGDDLTITASGAYSFATQVRAGAPYAVTVLAQPTSPWQTCTVGGNAAGNLPGPDTVVDVTCATDTHRVKVTTNGLPADAVVTLRNNGGDQLAVTGNVTAEFATQVVSGAGYAVTVSANPAGYRCSVANPSGTIGAADVTLAVECTEIVCQRMGFKRGSEDWSCPAGSRLPTANEFDLVSACILPEDTARFNTSTDIGISVGGCNCKWNGDWCYEPSIETMREGRACGDFEQLHICVR